MRKRLVLLLEILLFGAALLDVCTGWAYFSAWTAAALLVAGVAGLILGRGWTRFAWFTLLAVVFALHFSYAEYVRYETRNWEEVRAEKAAAALQKSLGAIDGLSDEVSSLAGKAAADESIIRGLEGGDYRKVFSALESLASSNRGSAGPHGLVVYGPAGRAVAWAGRLPGSLDGRGSAPAAGRLRFIESTTGYWLEASAPVELSGGPPGSVAALRMIEARYPGVLPHGIDRPLSEYLSAEVRHTVNFSPVGIEPPAGSGGFAVFEAVQLAGGEMAGTLTVEGRDLTQEEHLLKRQGLRLASIVVLVVLIMGYVRLGRILLGPRLAWATPATSFSSA